ncbi:MAG: beta-galactosidase [Bacteroides sp.]|nr:beta-galactosidase [Bacteroides sp.]
MKQIIFSMALLLTAPAGIALAAPVKTGTAPKSTLTTEWGEKVTPQNVWQQYPRPTLTRDKWQNLNGEWDYAILPKGASTPAKYVGKILVPYPVESQLSGVGKTVGEDNELWYRRKFTIPSSWKGQNINLNFGAVDWKADVWVNGVKVGGHEGGYSPFTLDMTDALKNGENELIVRVYDPSDKGTQPRGKQVDNPKGIWYTPVTGIWQTVWMEPVAKNSIEKLKITPDVDGNRLLVEGAVTGDGILDIAVFDNGKQVAASKGMAGEVIEVEMPADVKLWSTETPHIYDLTATLSKDGKIADKVGSYAAMRKVGIKRDDKGVIRFMLNDKPIFHFGPLDQGWWPDGLYTAPSYDAMVYDIDETKDLGFNMIRKHVKVEPELWYEYCDRNGILVWQDMPSGDKKKRWQNHNYHVGDEFERTPESDRQYRKEWLEIMENLHNHPSIVVWVPFNEAWGQYDTQNIATLTKDTDPSRLVNAASGGNYFFGAGDILDVHNYPEPRIYLLSDDQANVIGEYGGIGYPVKDHLWQSDRNWGYIEFKTPAELTDKYIEYIDILDNMANIAYTGGVYTQTTDVEGEVNGLLTYDRKVTKVDKDRVRKANRNLIRKYSKDSGKAEGRQYAPGDTK